MRNVCALVLLFIVLLQFSCTSVSKNSSSSAKESSNDPEAEKLLAKAIDRFNFSTFSSRVAIRKVYSEKVKFEDEMRILTKTENNRKKFLIQIKPGEKHPGKGMLIEQDENNKVTSAYIYTPGKEEPVSIEPSRVNAGDASVVIGGLSFLDIQILQGVRPFVRVRNEGVVNINSQDCQRLAIQFTEGQSYDRAQFFISPEELPILIKIFDRKGVAIKEISFEKFETISGKVFVKELVIKDQVYNYTSTLQFGNTRINDPIDEKVFTLDYLKKGWVG
jgi:hypothetical protein